MTHNKARGQIVIIIRHEQRHILCGPRIWSGPDVTKKGILLLLQIALLPQCFEAKGNNLLLMGHRGRMLQIRLGIITNTEEKAHIPIGDRPFKS